VIAILADDAFILERPVAGDSAGHWDSGRRSVVHIPSSNRIIKFYRNKIDSYIN
jgi:hypothetical protein